MFYYISWNGVVSSSQRYNREKMQYANAAWEVVGDCRVAVLAKDRMRTGEYPYCHIYLDDENSENTKKFSTM